MSKSKIEDFVIKDGILECFKENVEEVVIPGGVTVIQETAFIDCPKKTVSFSGFVLFESQ